MHITHVVLKNFRNYRDASIELAPGYNFFTGDNGSGKTNILEALSVASNTRSFRNSHDDDIISWGEDSYYCSAELSGGVNKKFEVGFISSDEKSRKKVKIDGFEIRKASDYFGKLLTVIISPDDIQLFGGIPEARRRFFDGIITRAEPEYYNALSKYRKSLASRNRVIREIREKGVNRLDDHLDAWNTILASCASEIIKQRMHFTERFNVYFGAAYEKISGGEYIPSLKYINNAISVESDEICSKLRYNIKRDISAGSTTIGPQRDDYVFENELGIDFKSFASQGQKRTASIALKNAELTFVEDKLKKKAVILVDDIFSELDDKRKKRLLTFLEGGNQVIFTMVSELGLSLKNVNPVRIFIVNNGTVSIK